MLFPLVVSGVMIAGLLGWLIVINRRKARADKRIARTPSKLPAIVDRPYDPKLCDYCDEKRASECPTCRRPLCGLHAPWREGLFCAHCEAEWETGARRRAIVIVPIVLVAVMAVAGVGIAIMELTKMRPGIGLLLVWLGCGAPMYLAIERWMRRGFRRRGQLARARQVR